MKDFFKEWDAKFEELKGRKIAIANDDNEVKHLNHDFYKDAAAYREKQRFGQILKGSKKYPEPFNPFSWSPKELLNHAMQENVDQAHYEYGLYLWIERLENELKEAHKDCEKYSKKWRGVIKQLNDVYKERDEWKTRYEREVRNHEETFNNIKRLEIPAHDCKKNQSFHWGAGDELTAITCKVCNKILFGEPVDEDLYNR